MEPTQTDTTVSDAETTVIEPQAAPTNGAKPVAPDPKPRLTVINPATGKVIADLPAITPADVPAMVERGRAAQGRWEAIGIQSRVRLFRELRRWLHKHEAEFVDTLSREGGKPIEDAFFLEWIYAMSSLDHWTKAAPKLLQDERRAVWHRLFVGNQYVQRRVPHGVVGVIGPWNYPFVNSLGDAIPALLAGNAVVLKPASKTPLTSLLVQRGMREVGFPDDVFQVAVGPGAVGSKIVDEVDMIMFTGSTEVGKGIAKQAAERLIPYSLELGGKDPLLVLDDADLEKAARHAVYYSLVNGGQTCMSIERIYVDTTVYDEFVERLVANFDKISFGDPTKGLGSVDVGAMTVASQADEIAAQVDAAVADGAKIVRGGKRVEPTDGAVYFEPTVLTEVRHGMEIVDEETFGPTLQVMRVDGVEDAIRQANDSKYGLAAAVYSRNLRRAEAVARRIEAGTVSINDSLIFWSQLSMEMGGWKESGAGLGRHGEIGLLKYTKPQGIYISRFPFRSAPSAMPYGPVSSLFKRFVKIYFRTPL